MLSNSQFEQLPMFMTAGELQKHELGDLIFHEGGPRSLLNKKYKQAQSSGLASKIEKSGVQEPVHLYHNVDRTKTLIDGHHRLAVALRMGKNTLLPVEHHDLETGF
jgi:hypothetical protein